MPKDREQPVAGENLEAQAADPTAAFVNSLIKECRKGVKAQHEAIRKAREFRFNQWEKADEQKLIAEERPIPQVDLTRKYLQATGGIEIINKTTVHCLARVPDSIEAMQKSELMTGVYQATLASCMGEFEHSVSFAQFLIDGMACSGQWLDDTLDAGGKIFAGQNIDMLEMAWDTQDKTQNLERGRYAIHFKITPKWVAMNQWPEEKEYIKRFAHDGDMNPLDEVSEVQHVTPFTYDPINTTKDANAKPKNYVTVREAFWYEEEFFHEIIDPFTQQPKELAASDFKEFQKTFREQYPEVKIESVRRRKRVYKRAFVIGNRTMQEDNSPMQTGFPFKFITGEWDPKEKVYRGLLFSLMEPQRLASKFMSQTMHVLATSGKRTTMYEEGAFDNIIEAEREMAQFNPFIKLSEGAMGGPGGSGKKYEIVPPAEIPEGMFTMWQTFLQLIRDVTGINIDMLGQSTGDIAGTTTRQRRMAGLATVAMFFNAYRRFLINETPGVLEYIQKFYTDDRWIRVGGEFNSQVVKLAKEDSDISWDFILDDTPQSEDARMDRWKALAESGIPAQMVKTGAIFFVPAIMDDAPMSAKQRFQFQAYLKQGADAQKQASQGGLPPGLGGKPQQKQPEKKQGPDPMYTQAKIQKLAADTQLTQTKAKAIELEAQLKKLDAMSQHMSRQSEERRKDQEHAVGIVHGAHELRRATEAHHLDAYTQVSKHLNDMARANEPQAQV